VRNNPLVYWDPTGYTAEDDARDMLLSSDTQQKIVDLKSMWYAAVGQPNEKALQDAAHDAAEQIAHTYDTTENLFIKYAQKIIVLLLSSVKYYIKERKHKELMETATNIGE
jgi:adenosylmethionine-8-amino-7-oxononanoate aminotransferase